jgi:hypothetical protein
MRICTAQFYNAPLKSTTHATKQNDEKFHSEPDHSTFPRVLGQISWNVELEEVLLRGVLVNDPQIAPHGAKGIADQALVASLRSVFAIAYGFEAPLNPTSLEKKSWQLDPRL